MEPNPYKAPTAPDGAAESGGPWNQDRTTQLLTEIRDLQREGLALTRKAVARQRRLGRFALWMTAILVLAVGLLMTGNVLALLLSPPPPRPPTAPPTVSQVIPQRHAIPNAIQPPHAPDH